VIKVRASTVDRASQSQHL